MARVRALLVFALVFVASVAEAQPRPPLAPSPTTDVTLGGALRMAARDAPVLAPAEAAVRGAATLVEAADTTLTRNPTVSVGVGPRSVAPTGDFDVDVTATLMFPVPLGGVGSARASYAEAAVQAAESQRELTQLEGKGRAAMAWLDALAAERIVALHREMLTNAEELARIAGVRDEVGSANPNEAPLARAEVGQAKARLAAARRQEALALIRLRFAVGLPLERDLRAVGSLDVSTLPGPAAERRALRAHPAPRTSRARALAADRAADLTLAEAVPSLSFGPSFTREGTGDWLVLGQISLPLPLTNTSVVGAADARREAIVARAQGDLVAQRLQRDVAAARAAHAIAVEERDLLAGEAVAPAARALELSLLQYKNGNGQLADVIQARRSVVAARLQLTEAQRAVRRAELTLRALLNWPGGTP